MIWNFNLSYLYLFRSLKRSKLHNILCGIPYTIVTSVPAITTLVRLQGVELNIRLAGRLQNDVVHVNESYRSPPNSVFSRRNDQFNMFYPCRRVMLLKIVLLCEGLSQVSSIFISISRKIVILCRLFTFCVQGDYPGVKMRGDTFPHESKRHRVIIEALRVSKLW